MAVAQASGLGVMGPLHHPLRLSGGGLGSEFSNVAVPRIGRGDRTKNGSVAFMEQEGIRRVDLRVRAVETSLTPQSSPAAPETVSAVGALGPKTWVQSMISLASEQILGRQELEISPPRLRILELREEQQTGDDTQKLEISRSQSRSTASSMMSRRVLLSSVFVGSTIFSLPIGEEPALADSKYREYIDRLDGYIFSYPSGWIQVRGAGADVFFRDPVNLDENVVVDFSSPSSSRYKSVEDLGTPEQAAQKVLKQKITEFMSTRLGVRRVSKVVSANSRVGDDGRLYYDIEVDVKSYANTNELAVMPADRVVKLEWSRRYLSTLGVENNRLYELRLQAPEKVLAKEGKDLRQIMDSFQLVKLDV